MEDVDGEEEEGVTTMEVEIVRTLVGTVVEDGTLVEEVAVETVVGMEETMTEMDRERHENSKRGTLQYWGKEKERVRAAKQSVKIPKKNKVFIPQTLLILGTMKK